MLAAYYRELNAHPPLRSDLAALRKRLALQFPADGRWTVRREDDEDEPEYPWTSQDAWLPAKARKELLAFTKRWRLPPAAARDALFSIRISPEDSEPEIVLWVRSQVGASPYAFIRADQPVPFMYDPIGAPTPAAARRKARAAGDAVYRQMIAQIERAEKEWRAAGRKSLPPRSANKADLDEGAKRLFQHAILKWTWKAIADASDASTRRRAYDEATIAEGVKRWASALGIELPAASRRSRKVFQ